jgi:hypothetical protein
MAAGILRELLQTEHAPEVVMATLSLRLCHWKIGERHRVFKPSHCGRHRRHDSALADFADNNVNRVSLNVIGREYPRFGRSASNKQAQN